MNQRKIMPIVVMSMMLVSVSVAIVPTTKAEMFHTVAGYLYLDGELTDGIDVTLSLSSNSYNCTTYSNDQISGRYDVSFVGHEGETGAFGISCSGTIMDNQTIVISMVESVQRVDLHVNTNSSPNDPPYTPNNPMPSDGSTDMGLNVDLWWDGGDPDGDPVTYDVFFEANDLTPDLLVSDGQSGTHYDPGTLNQDTTYYWQIISYDDHVHMTTGPIWSFTTMDQANRQPNEPTPVAPSDGTTVDSTTSATLKVQITDPDGDTMEVRFYKVDGTHIETKSAVPNGSTASVTWSGLSSGTSYSWYAMVNDSEFENTSDTWSFTTKISSSDDSHITSGNNPPVANASASETFGYIGESINFDGFLSTDSDGTIELYEWDWDNDGVYEYNSTSSTATHTFDAEGSYLVTLRVTDNVGATDTDTIDVIISKANNPPTNLEVQGETKGHKNTEYAYTATATDPDENDTVRYIFEWGDGTNDTISSFLTSDSPFSTSHSWASYGSYTIEVYAEDNSSAPSGTTKLIVLIDMHYVKNIGHLIDDNSNGTYDIFYSNSTEEQTDVEQQGDGTYLIDSDGDGEWDYVYDIETNTLTEYSAEPTPEPDNTALIVLAIIAILILIVLGYLVKRDKDKKKKAAAAAAAKKSKPKKKTASKKSKK